MNVSTRPKSGETPLVRLPDPARLFEARAVRLHALSAGHSAPDWLLLLSRVAEGQARAAREIAAEVETPGAGGPPLAAAARTRDGAWRRMLGVVLAASAAPGLPDETLAAMRSLERASAPELEASASAVLAGRVPRAQLASAPFVGAALQAWLAALASRVDPETLSAARGECPVCGGPPVAALLGGDRLRYVTCSLCCSEWHVPRLCCTSCGAEAGVFYVHAEGDRGVQAEACGACRTYLKLFDAEERPGAEAAADDAASLALDLLMGEEGYARTGANLYVAAGA